ncbi:MAG TPA: large-conductance mechanosensitive channel protein MscL [Xanthomonadales bacterium]|nr:large-conductance mechanosensitive channel protein MscL [Xanthomonadales bacterium]
MGMLSEFKAFAMRGNVIDLAVGVVIGAAFGKIVTALVDNVIMPPIGLAIGGVDFTKWKWVLKPAVGETAEVAIGIGAFINTIIQFTIIAFAIFLLVKAVNRLSRKEAEKPADPPAPTTDQKLLTEIRDLLAAQRRP